MSNYYHVNNFIQNIPSDREMNNIRVSLNGELFRILIQINGYEKINKDIQITTKDCRNILKNILATDLLAHFMSIFAKTTQMDFLDIYIHNHCVVRELEISGKKMEISTAAHNMSRSIRLKPGDPIDIKYYNMSRNEKTVCYSCELIGY